MARLNAQDRNAIQRSLGDRKRGGFSKGLADFHRKIAAFDASLLDEVGDLMYQSIVYGSALTGAPGQPRKEGDLIASWRKERPSETSVAVVSDSPYARPNEDGLREGGKPYVQRSPVGGRHSVKLTRRGLQRLVNQAAKNVAAETPRAA